jgi:hypothetical protein
MEVYEILEQTPYGITLSKCAIEDAGDEFFTAEEVNEMGLYTYDHGSMQIRKQAVKSAVEEWLTKIPEGKKSIKCTDTQLISAIKSGGWSISDFVKNTRRVGDRISYHKPTEKTRVLKAGDVNCLFNIIDQMIGSECIEIKCIGKVVDKLAVLPILKKLVSWEDIVAEGESTAEKTYWARLDQEQLDLLKPLWNDDDVRNEYIKTHTKEAK